MKDPQRMINDVVRYIESLESHNERKEFVEDLIYATVIQTADCCSESLQILSKVGITIALWHEDKIMQEKVTKETQRLEVSN